MAKKTEDDIDPTEAEGKKSKEPAAPSFASIVAKVAKAHPHVLGDPSRSKLKWCPCDSPNMTYMLGGGIPVGRMIRFRGPESSGKTATCTYIAAQLQKHLPEFLKRPTKDKVIFIDFERTFEEKYAATIGLNTTYVINEDQSVNPNGKFIHVLADDIETAGAVTDEFVRSDDIAAIIFDSDAMGSSKAQFTDELGKASFGGGARAISDFLKRMIILCANHDTTLLWISQERAPIGDMWAKVDKPTGGRMPGFASSIIIRTTKDEYIKSGDETIGMKVHSRNYKNKCSIPFRESFNTLYYHGGFNVDEEYIDYFDKLGFVKNNRGNYYSEYWEGCLKGGEKYKAWLKNNPEIYEELKNKTMEAFKSFNAALDKNNADIEKEVKEKNLENQDDLTPEELAQKALEIAGHEEFEDE